MTPVKAIYKVIMSEKRDFDNGRTLIEYQLVHTTLDGTKHYRVAKQFTKTSDGVTEVPIGTQIFIVGDKRPNNYKDHDGNTIDKGTYIHVELLQVLVHHTPEETQAVVDFIREQAERSTLPPIDEVEE